MLEALLQGKDLATEYKDHSLIGNWNYCRECHIYPNLLLIYRVIKVRKELQLIRLGSHSELFK